MMSFQFCTCILGFCLSLMLVIWRQIFKKADTTTPVLNKQSCFQHPVILSQNSMGILREDHFRKINPSLLMAAPSSFHHKDLTVQEASNM